MVAKFHAMTGEDYIKLGPIVKSGFSGDSFDRLDVYDGSSVDVSDVMQSLANMHTRKVISLAAPTFNYVLGRSRCSLLAKILGIPHVEWSNIVSFTVVLDKVTKELVPIDEADPSGDYLYGAQIAEYYIKTLDIEAAKIDCLYSAISGCLCMSAKPREVVAIVKGNVPNGVLLTCDYYALYDPAVLADNYKRGHAPEEFINEFRSKLFVNADTRFTYLMNMNPDKSGLFGMLNYYVAVVPQEMRPKIDRSEHKLTSRYAKVLKADFEYRAICGEHANPKDIKAKYATLDSMVSRLQYKNVGLKLSSTKRDDLAVLERVKSKKGQIRMNNLGKRQDYSGRAVVVINPYLPIDHIRVPKAMLPKLYEYHLLPYLARNIANNKKDREQNTEHVRNIYDKVKLTNLGTNEARAEMLRILKEEEILNDIPAYLGRQPTLHKQSLQGFYIEASELNAIEVSPLVCPAFNMDFDGDQAHIEVPLGDDAIREIRDLLMTTQNRFMAKTGECTFEPRQDMLYGLYMCTRDEYVVGEQMCEHTFANYEEVRQWVMQHKVKVYETVSVADPGVTVLAGEAAVIACFAPGDVLPRGSMAPTGQLVMCQITSKTITKFVEHTLRTDPLGNFIYPLGTGYDKPGTFVGTINYLVELGFKVARLYSTTVSLLAITGGDIVRKDINKFHEEMKETNFYYGLGMETPENYQIEFDKKLKTLDDATSAEIFNMLGENNGYANMSKSGARGSKSNLLQAFAYKGRVKKNSYESFNALIENSYKDQVTPMEHFVDAFGGRQGQMDKSLKTGDTGYAMRQMWHATQGMYITTKDCGTREGLVVSKEFLVQLAETPDSSSEAAQQQVKKEVADMFKHAIVGRYKVGSSKTITAAEAEEWANDDSIDSIEIRSPLRCKNPCCSRCYGIDWSTRKVAQPGFVAGITAAQSIGEPGAQLTLKQFQKGGVAGKAEFNSAFDKVNAYIHVQDLGAQSKKGTYSGYDPVAWETGRIIEQPSSDISMKVVTIEGSSRKLLIPKTVLLKEYATKGLGLSYRHGDYSIPEMLNICTLAEAQRYLAFKLYYLYKSEVEIAMVHFETLVASMTRYMIVSTDRNDLMVGQYCTQQELFSGSVANTIYVPRLLSVTELLQASNEALDAIQMENQAQGLSRICLLELTDTLTKPINRMVLGLTIEQGSAVSGFIEERKEKIR